MKEVADKKMEMIGLLRRGRGVLNCFMIWARVCLCFQWRMEDGGRGTHKRIHIYVCSQEDLEAGELGIF